MMQAADELLSDRRPPAPAAANPGAAAGPLPKAALPRQAPAPGAGAGGAPAARGVPQTPFVATRQARASAAVAQQLLERRQVQPGMQVGSWPGELGLNPQPTSGEECNNWLDMVLGDTLHRRRCNSTVHG
jgi:hypothetical protein